MSHPRAIDPRLGLVLLVLGLLLAFAGTARAAVAVGGVGARGAVTLADVNCVKQCIGAHKVRPGSTVRLRGLDLEEVRQVVFRGSRGPLQVEPMRRTERTATAIVPDGAVAGRPYVIDRAGHQSPPSPHKLFILPSASPPPLAAASGATYPIAGKHELWEGFGGAREHGGADIGAACGTPLVAALAGTVEYNKYEPRGGNYLVIDADGVDADLVYMHMSAPSPLKVGQKIAVGAAVGTVGDTGNASGCHLHFEYWIGEAWLGGEAVDPVPYLTQWEGATG
ncbi:MAG: M23 family metallopeptidase [Actinobacteria bacterium]|nr:M23 family metallopeptidase [Actinomycetota bacterium]